jgi:DNA-binding beta-propeller fold protein YncE
MAVTMIALIGFLNHDAYGATYSFHGWIGNCISGTDCNTVSNVTTGFCSDCTGTFLHGSGNGQFAEMIGVTLDNAGNIYVVDTGNARIQKFNSEGVYLLQFGSYGTGNGQFNTPFGIALDNTGDIYVADMENHRLQKFNSAGTYLFQFGSIGTGNGQFNGPQGVTLDNAGNIYVVDTYNARIQKFNSEGVYLLQFGSYGTGNGQFRAPDGIALDNAGNIYVADTANQRVQKFNSSGVYQFQIGVTGATGINHKHFNRPAGVALDNAGNIYVTDTYNRRVEEFNSAGVYQSTVTYNQFPSPQGIAVDNAGTVYVTDYSVNVLEKFHVSFTAIASGNWNSSVVWGATIPGPTDSIIIPSGITVTIPLGYLVQIDSGGNLSNSGTINNYYIINNRGTISNSGTINVFCGALINGNIVAGNPINTTKCIPIVLHASKDSFVSQHANATNFGANDTLIVAPGGPSRALISFDLAPYETRQVSNATLRLYITSNGNNWGGINSNRAIESHKMISNWTEGNGISKTSRGSGQGVTWNCSTDTDITNKLVDCLSVWNGGSFSGITDSKIIKNSMVNQWIEFNVTSDVDSFLDGNPNDNFGWVIKKSDETNSGLVGFASKENDGNSSLAPQLVLTFK